MARRLHRTLALSVVAAFVLAGCTGAAQDADRGEPGMDPSLTVTDLTTFSLPLDPYQVNPITGRRLASAYSILYVQCMRRFGFDPQTPSRTDPPPPSVNGKRYGLVDERDAQRYGYHDPYASQRLPPTEPRLSPEAEAIAAGTGSSRRRAQAVPEGGCLGEATRKLAEGAPTPEDSALAVRLSLTNYARSKYDSRVWAVFAAWGGPGSAM